MRNKFLRIWAQFAKISSAKYKILTITKINSAKLQKFAYFLKENEKYYSHPQTFIPQNMAFLGPLSAKI